MLLLSRSCQVAMANVAADAVPAPAFASGAADVEMDTVTNAMEKAHLDAFLQVPKASLPKSDDN